MTIPISPRASPIALPALRASSTASSSRCSASVSASECSRRARSPGASARQAGRAALAAATARSTSSTPARGISESTASVAGSRTESRPLTVQPSVIVRDPAGPSWKRSTVDPPYGAWAISGRATSVSRSSTVLTGPLNVFFAEARYQTVTAIIVPTVTSGA